MKPFFTSLLILSSLCFSSIDAQIITTEGTKFWLGFTENGGLASPVLNLQISGKRIATGTVSTSNGLFTSPFTITPGVTTTINIPALAAHNTSNNAKGDFGILVEASDSIFVFASNFKAASSDASLALPVSALGSEYYLMSYSSTISSNKCEFVIVGTADDTEIEIIPSQRLSAAVDSGDVLTITLNEGQTYQGKAFSNNDLTGSFIRSTDPCKPIVVIGGNECTNIPAGFATCDHIYEVMIPTKAWGRNYLIMPWRTRGRSVYRVISSEDNNSVFFNGFADTTIILNKGEFYEDIIVGTQPIAVSGSGPLNIAHYSPGDAFDGNDDNGDPFMVMLLPSEQNIDNITFSALAGNNTNHYVNIYGDSLAAATMTLNDTNIFRFFRKFAQDERFYYSQYDLGINSIAFDINLKSDGKFNAVAYGYGLDDSYGYGAGGRLKSLNFDILVDSPLCVGNEVQFSDTSRISISEFLWDFGDGTTSTLAAPSHTYNTAGDYTVKLGIRILPCAPLEFTTKNIIIEEAPFAPTIVGDTEACENQSISLSGSYNQTVSEFRWFSGPTGGVALSTDSIYVSPELTANLTVYLEVVVPPSCISLRQKHDISLKSVQAAPSPIVVCGKSSANSQTFNWSAVGGAVGYEVSVDSGQTWIDPSAGATGTTHAISGLGSDETAKLRVRALMNGECAVGSPSPELECSDDFEFNIPTAFSPNGDGNNDTFGGNGSGIDFYKMQVFNRWGQEVFGSNEILDRWDGIISNSSNQAPAGVYIYLCNVSKSDGSNTQFQGVLTLVR
jgi:gliding motility-associated-like protein